MSGRGGAADEALPEPVLEGIGTDGDLSSVGPEEPEFAVGVAVDPDAYGPGFEAVVNHVALDNSDPATFVRLEIF